MGAVYLQNGETPYLTIFNRKSKILASIDDIPLGRGAQSPLLLDFGAQGTKAILCPLDDAVQVLQFVPLKLTDEEKDVLKNAYTATSELKSEPPKNEAVKPKM